MFYKSTFCFHFLYVRNYNYSLALCARITYPDYFIIQRVVSRKILRLLKNEDKEIGYIIQGQTCVYSKNHITVMHFCSKL